MWLKYVPRSHSSYVSILYLSEEKKMSPEIKKNN